MHSASSLSEIAVKLGILLEQDRTILAKEAQALGVDEGPAVTTSRVVLASTVVVLGVVGRLEQMGLTERQPSQMTDIAEKAEVAPSTEL